MGDNKRYDIFTVREAKNEGDKPFWTKIGMGIVNRDGVSFSIFLDALPTNGKLQMRLPQERTNQGGNERGGGGGRDF